MYHLLSRSDMGKISFTSSYVIITFHHSDDCPYHVEKSYFFKGAQLSWSPVLWLVIENNLLHFAGDTWTETLAYVMFWGTASFGTLAIILYNGKDFVDAPRLVQKEKMDWICVCGKRLGRDDSSVHTWSLYWPAFHTNLWGQG